VRVCVHMGECSYVYEDLHLYRVSKKTTLSLFANTNKRGDGGSPYLTLLLQ
jgi:hypothetical protein